MTHDEYEELAEFLGRQFDDVRDCLTRVEVSVEENRHRIQLVAEAVTTVDQKLDRFKEETAGEFRAVRGEMAEGLAAVRGEMAEGLAAVRGELADGFSAHGKLFEALQLRISRWDGSPA